MTIVEWIPEEAISISWNISNRQTVRPQLCPQVSHVIYIMWTGAQMQILRYSYTNNQISLYSKIKNMVRPKWISYMYQRITNYKLIHVRILTFKSEYIKCNAVKDGHEWSKMSVKRLKSILTSPRLGGCSRAVPTFSLLSVGAASFCPALAVLPLSTEYSFLRAIQLVHRVCGLQATTTVTDSHQDFLSNQQTCKQKCHLLDFPISAWPLK